jgi:Family of unknown function (DUF5993)
VDILIMILLLVIGLLIWRGAGRATTVVLMIGLFKYHVTSHLDLSF